MSDEMRECLKLIAELAKAASEWEGGHYDGASYAAARWRHKLETIAERASRLADKARGANNG